MKVLPSTVGAVMPVANMENAVPFLVAGLLDKSAICGIERDFDDRGVALSGHGRVLVLVTFGHCDCRCQGSQSRYSCNARNNLLLKDIWETLS